MDYEKAMAFTTPTTPQLPHFKYSNRVLLKTILDRSDGGLELIGQRVLIGGWVKFSKEVMKQTLPRPSAADHVPARQAEPKSDVSCVEILQSNPRKPKSPKRIPIPTSENPTPSEFSTAMAQTIVAQICHSIGFKATSLSALESLTQVAINYLVAIAKSSASYAAKANRTDSNLFDFTNAIHDLSLVQGFKGGSGLHKSCVLGSTVLKDFAKFVEYTNETPFAWPIPRREKIGVEESLVPRNRESGSVHIPRWLPGFLKVGETKVVKRRNGEELWEDLVVENGNGDIGIGNGSKELGVKSKRGRVRFKIGGVREKVGVKMRNGVCRGGKRVCWNGNGSDGYNLNAGIFGVDDDGNGKR